MKNPIQFVLTIAILALIFACGEPESKEESSDEQMKEDQTHMEETNQEDHMNQKKKDLQLKKGDLKLNDGRPWTANLETTMGIRNMKQHMTEYDSINHVNDCKELQKELHKELNYIIRSCTMEGEPHNQLHHYLYTIQKNFEGLKSNQIDSCRHSYERINTQLAKYSKYFANKE